MNEPFTVEWLGGPAEHHFRSARPLADFDWQSLDTRDYPPELVSIAREVWTGIAVSEYAAIASFANVVSALAAARAPLDLIGMTSDFLADEVHHVELASRLVMRLGGAAPRPVDTARLAPIPDLALSPFERANELALRVGCIAEVFASATAAPIMRETAHPLVKSVYQSILRDEARHRRFGTLYFEWAADRLSPSERARLGAVTLDALEGYAKLWRSVREVPDHPAAWGAFDEHELGWIEPSRYVPLAQSVVRDQILPPLREFEIVPDADAIEALLSA